jgi:uncharacterized membrane protein
MKSRQRGQSTLYAIVLMPVLLLVFSLVADVGSLQVERVRLKWAQDMALVDAVTEVDSAHYAATGDIRIDPVAVSVYRAYLAANLESMRGALAAGATPESIAAAAEVVVVDHVPGVDPFSGRTLDRPAICARLRAPFNSGLLRLAGLDPMQDLTVTGDAEVRA